MYPWNSGAVIGVLVAGAVGKSPVSISTFLLATSKSMVPEYLRDMLIYTPFACRHDCLHSLGDISTPVDCKC